MAAYSSAICMRLDNSMEPPPLRFAKHPERAGDLRPTRPAWHRIGAILAWAGGAAPGEAVGRLIVQRAG